MTPNTQLVAGSVLLGLLVAAALMALQLDEHLSTVLRRTLIMACRSFTVERVQELVGEQPIESRLVSTGKWRRLFQHKPFVVKGTTTSLSFLVLTRAFCSEPRVQTCLERET